MDTQRVRDAKGLELICGPTETITKELGRMMSQTEKVH
jgi:hypothetical protein